MLQHSERELSNPQRPSSERLPLQIDSPDVVQDWFQLRKSVPPPAGGAPPVMSSSGGRQ
jgi:hypothetical protein